MLDDKKTAIASISELCAQRALVTGLVNLTATDFP